MDQASQNPQHQPSSGPEAHGTARLRRLGSWGNIVVGVASVIGAGAAVLVFFLPSADVTQQPPVPPVTTSPVTVDGAARPSSSTQPSSSASGRSLAELTPEVGAGLVTTFGGGDLELACPSNQSDDRSDEITYVLTAPFSGLRASVSMMGPAGPDDAVGVETFIQYREDRADRRAAAGRAVAYRDRPGTLTTDLTHVARLSLVVTCSNPRTRVRIGSPALVG